MTIVGNSGKLHKSERLTGLAMQSRFITASGVIFSAVLACPFHASVLETARINVGSNFSTCLGPSPSTDGGAEAVINRGGQQTVTGFPLPALMSYCGTVYAS